VDKEVRSLLDDVVRLMLTMPTLIHHAVQSQSDEPSHPEVVAGAPHGSDGYKPAGFDEMEQKEERFLLFFRFGTLPLYMLTWGMITLAYFV
jgi:hypothetical protein